MAERDAKRRFLALKVDEVSLVDSPANEQEFIVIKRAPTEENTMTVATKETPAPSSAPAAAEATPVVKGTEGKTETKTETATPEVVPVAVAKSTDGESAKVLAQLEHLTEAIAKIAGAVPAQETDVEKAKKKKDAEEQMRKSLSDAGLKGVQLEKALAAALTAEEPAATPTTKADEADEGEATAKTLEAIAEAIQKAKTFTPKREKALKSVLEDLTKLLGELSSPAAGLPSGVALGSGLSDVKKALEEMAATVKAAVDTTVTTQKALAERLEVIEKTRNPSQSITPETGTTTAETKKGFWAGVL